MLLVVHHEHHARVIGTNDQGHPRRPVIGVQLDGRHVVPRYPDDDARGARAVEKGAGRRAGICVAGQDGAGLSAPVDELETFRSKHIFGCHVVRL